MSPQIFVISESSNNFRLNQFKSQFPKHGDDLVIIPAVMGAKMDAADYYNYLWPNYNKTQRVLSPAEVGCALSHLSIYKIIVQSKTPAIIFEDDILGSDEDIAQAIKLSKNIKPHQVIILGGPGGTPEEKFVKFVVSDFADVGELNQRVKKVDTLSYPYLGSACCYIIGHQAAAIIIEKQQTYLHVADAWGHFSENENFEFFYTHMFTHPVLNESLDSYIEHERRSIVYIPSYKLAMRNMVRLGVKKLNQFKISRLK